MPNSETLEEAARRTWATTGRSAESLDPLTETVGSSTKLLRIWSERCIEALFQEESSDIEMADKVVNAVRIPGWTVMVVVPLARMGQAHEVLRNCGAFIQPWWRDATGDIRFGGYELA